MAIYHCNVSIGTRSKGSSSVGSLAYREGNKITDNRTGITHDYSKKLDVIESITLLPKHAPKRFLDSGILWNEVEKIEKRKDAQLFREVEVALPHEMTHEQNKKLIIEYCENNFIDAGMCSSISFHSSKTDNPHAHIMLTMRDVTEVGFGQKNRDWNQRKMIEEWRKNWAEKINKHLELNNVGEKVDHRSLAAQGLDKKATIHLGYVAHAMEQRGEQSERGNINRQIMAENQDLMVFNPIDGIRQARIGFHRHEKTKQEALRAKEREAAIERDRLREKIATERTQAQKQKRARQYTGLTR